MIATDNHLGYKEDSKDKTDRYMDSFNAFEEVLQKAVEHKADFVLLGGSFNLISTVIFSTRNILLSDVYSIVLKSCRNMYLGTTSKEFRWKERLQTTNLILATYSIATLIKTHFNIGLPIFVINGNHDNHSSDDSLE